MRAILAFILYLSIATIANAQAVSKSEIDRKGNQFFLKTEGSQCQIEVCTPSMIRFCLAGVGGFTANENYMINRYNWEEVSFSVNELGDVIELKTNCCTSIRPGGFLAKSMGKAEPVMNGENWVF